MVQYMSTLNYLDTALARVHPAWLATLNRPDIAHQLQDIDQGLSRHAQAGETIYPPRASIFAALNLPPEQIRVVILGQDPYHGAGEAMGLSFSVPAGIRIPPSLRNIDKELASDLDFPIPVSGDLSVWAEQGVLLLNSVLTVAADKAGSHGKLGWQAICDALIDTINHENPGCVFLLWGKWAQSKAARIDSQRHAILCTAHPSPLSAYRGFFGCRHFSQSNAWLQRHGYPPIDWQRA